ncbi:2-keto-4-pentenoate hydratase [Wenjunlia tyrosinilytica]|jgi:2-keto-4-pentenoate hydratase|uniref:2-keto-4-pentenoate hydratase n=1 Tax=Wenjunlia tyrosinilytica TaxID=1544741 RepID=A0A918E176_9ACTN|nr:fumarylacetoacetate hydrolase family protein [Wenjunlia tyrosinilytica]GGO99469.1 2-keto-4-pentenoate hydratase [Wenjunlia tyrosinilytica]
MSDVITQAATRLQEAARKRVPCPPVRDLIGTQDMESAYAVQAATLSARVTDGERVVGHKIGLTSPAVQRQLGVYQPDFGTLTGAMAYTDAEPLPLGRFLQPRIEAEVAFVLGRDLTSEYSTVADVLRATEFLLPAIEIVDSRIADWDIRITDTIADNGSAGAFVLGTSATRPDAVALADIGMVIDHRGAPVSTGAGAACLGSPVAAVVWLANELARRGRPLQAGQIVLSGALGPVVSVTSPGVYRACLETLGSVRATFQGESS